MRRDITERHKFGHRDKGTDIQIYTKRQKSNRQTNS